MRFPSHKKVADIKNYPSFNLRKEGVQVEVLEWIGGSESVCKATRGLGVDARDTAKVVSLEGVHPNCIGFWADD